MATITLRKSKFDGIQSVLDKLKASFKNYEASLNELKRTAEGVDSSACSLEDAIDDIASSSDSEKEKVEKIQKLNQKIEAFVNTAIQREKSARDKIVEKKNDFYKRYKNLKPDCEKGRLERACEKVAEVAKAVRDWIVEHIDIIIAAIIILVAIIICIVCPAAIVAIIGAIACALSAVMGIADLVCMATHGGKDIATVLAKNGHGTLAKIWSGTSLGLDIASIILPVGAGIKTAMTVGGKTFAQTSKSMLKETWKSIKGIPKNIKQSFVGFKNACKSNGFFKTLGFTTWCGFKSITGIDDIQNLKNIGKIKEGNVLKGASIIENKNNKHWNMDTNKMCMTPKTDDAKQAIAAANKRLGTSYTSVPLTNKNGYIDVDWDALSIKTLGKEDGFNMTNLGLSGTRDGFDNKLDRFISTGDSSQFKHGLIGEIYGNKKSKAKVALNNSLSSSGTTINLTGITFHENFDLSHENLVPTQLHDLIGHNGGREHITQEITKIRFIDRIFLRGTAVGGTDLTIEAVSH